MSNQPKRMDKPRSNLAIPGECYIHGKSGVRYLCTALGYNSNNTEMEEGRVEVYYVGPTGLKHNRSLAEWSELARCPDGLMRPRFYLEY